MKGGRIVVGSLVTIAFLHAQVQDVIVEYWTGMTPTSLRAFQYTGTMTLAVGGSPFYSGPVTYRYQWSADTSLGIYRYTLERTDTSGFAGLNFTVTDGPAFSSGSVLRLGLFPFIDVHTLNPWYEFPLAPDTARPPQDTFILHNDLVPASPLLLMLDPGGTYSPSSADTLWIDNNATYFVIFEGMVDTMGWSWPQGCVPRGDSLRLYRIVIEDTVHMWDGSIMLLRMDRYLWMIPACFVVKDSVYRTLVPLAGKAQSQTLNSSLALDNITSVEEQRLRTTSTVRVIPVPGGFHITGIQPGDKVRARDILGRTIFLKKRGDVYVFPAHPGVVFVEVERSGGKGRIILKGISLR